MAKHITSFWVRLCGFFVWCISTIFSLDTNASGADGSLAPSERYRDCNDQNFDFTFHDNQVSEIHPDKEYWDKVTPIYVTDIDCNNDADAPGDYAYEYYVDPQDYPDSALLCANTSPTACSIRLEYEGYDSAGAISGTSSGLRGYFGPVIRGHVLGCYQPDSSQDTGKIAFYGYCADAEVTIFGCGQVDEDGKFTSNKDSTGRPQYLIDKNNKILLNVNSIITRNNFGVFTTNTRDKVTGAPEQNFTYATDGRSALEQVAKYYGYSCAKCAYDPLGNLQKNGALGYSGNTSPGSTWDLNKCYINVQTNPTNTVELTDSSGTYIFPLTTSSGCKCFYNGSSYCSS